MTGEVDHRGTPIVRLTLGGREWVAIIDTGLDGALVLPSVLAADFAVTLWGEAEVTLAGGQMVMEKLFTIDLPFDGGIRKVRTSFAPIPEVLIGTEMLAGYRLEINFVARTVLLEKVATP